MIDPFTAWSRMVAAGLDMQSTWLRGLETLQASQTVIGVRANKMGDAMRSPLQADMTEFARMTPEKVDAFSKSARAVTKESIRLQSAWIAQMHRVSLMMMRGRIPTFLEASTLGSQTVSYSLGAMSAVTRLSKVALAPVHRTAVANARRLSQEQSK